VRPVLAFDMNGTLLDLAALDPLFKETFGSADRRREWFSQMLMLAMATTMTGEYLEFSKIGDAALSIVAARESVNLNDDSRARILQAVRHMPPFPDVPAALERLRANDYRLIVLTNSPSSSAEESLSSANLRDRFEAVLSVDRVQRFKPAPEVYHMAANKMRIEFNQLMLVAAHSWDTTGALRAGCRAAFIARPGEILDPLGPKPQIVARDFNDFASQLLAMERSSRPREAA
jgi:2-haloacid dehalogenase